MQKRNWKEYNEHLVRRGEILFSIDFLENWDEEIEKMNEGKRGRPYDYPQSFMIFLKILHDCIQIKYRQLEGFVRALSKYIPKIKAPSFSQIRRRSVKIEIDLYKTLKESKDDFVIAVDSSGVKVANRGEWMREKWKVHRGWIKIHVAVDVNTKEIIAIEVTDERTGDGKMLKPLIEKAEKNVGKGKIKRVSADGAYDSKENFEYLDGKGIEPAIKTRKNSSTRARGSPARARHVREMKELSYEGWRDKYRYGQRWMAETTFSRGKREYGEYVTSRNLENMVKEVEFQYGVLNLMMNEIPVYLVAK